METKKNQNQVVITLDSEEKKQKLPLALVVTLTVGTLTGVAVIFGLMWGIEKLVSF